MKKNRRRQYLMDRGAFQYRFLLPFVLSWLLAALSATALFNWLVRQEIDKLLWKAHVAVQTTDQVIGSVFIYSILASLVLVLFFVSLSCLLVRRQTKGAALRMVTDLRQVAAGDFAARVRLRQQDPFQDVAAALNGFIEERALRYQNLRDDLAALQTDLRAMRLVEARGGLPHQDLQRIRDRVALLRQGLGLRETLAPPPGEGCGLRAGGGCLS